jgi:hypothetical protein
MKYLTTDTLIDSVKRRASIPASQSTFLDEDFIAFANEELDLGIIPHVLSFHEEYFVYTQVVPLVANTSRYQIPTRAVGSKLRELSYQNDDGNIFEMTRIKVDDIPQFQTTTNTSTATVFYVEGTDIVLVPGVNASPTGSLRFSYYLRPNELVSEDRVAIVTGINRTSGDVTVASVPSVISVADTLDLIQTKSPHKTLSLDITAVGINTTTKTFTFDPDDLPAGLAIGDQIALAGETIVPQIPSDLHSMLSQRVAARCLESLGDAAGLTAANTKLAEMEQKTGTLIQNRVEGAPLKVVTKHSSLKKHRWGRF